MEHIFSCRYEPVCSTKSGRTPSGAGIRIFALKGKPRKRRDPRESPALHDALLIGARHSIAAHAEDWSPSAFELRNRFEARNRARLHTGAAVARQLLAVADEVVGTWASGDLAAAIRKLGQRCPLSTEADVNSLNPDAHASLQQNAAAIYRPKVKPYRALVNTTPS